MKTMKTLTSYQRKLPNRMKRTRQPQFEPLERRALLATLSPFSALQPSGSLAYQASGSGLVAVSGGTDTVVLNLDAGQTVSVAVIPLTFNGHQYAQTNKLNWQDAETAAQSKGGHLVSINSQAEQDFLTRTFLLGGNERNAYWIGLTDRTVEGQFAWASGDAVTYTNWDPGEPNNASDEDFAMMNWHMASGNPNGNAALGDWNDTTIDGTGLGLVPGIVEIPGPGGIQPSVSFNGSSTSAAHIGDSVVLQNASVATTGSYAIDVSGLNGTTGGYALRVVLNGAMEAESYGLAPNDLVNDAQPVTDFLPIGPGAGQMSVVGTLPATSYDVPIKESFESGSLGSSWTTYSSATTGRIRVTSQYGAGDGSNALIMDDSKAKGTPTLNEAVWTIDLAGQSQAQLAFRHAAWSDEVAAFSGAFTGHSNADGIAISADGTNWYPVWTPPNQANGVWTSYEVDLTSAAAANGISLGHNFRIKFQQYGSEPLTNDGRGWDSIEVRVPGNVPEDWYSWTLDPGQSVTLTATAQASTGVSLELHGTSGLIASGDNSPTNVGQAVTYESPSGGVYYARVTQNGFYATGRDYALTITKGAAFDLENNASTPQTLSNGVAVGAIDQSTEMFVAPGSGGLNASEKFVFLGTDAYVVSRNSNQIMRYDTAGRPKPSAGNSGAVFASGNGLNSPVGIAWGPDGNLYVANYGSSTVVKFDANGNGLGTVVAAKSGGLDGVSTVRRAWC